MMKNKLRLGIVLATALLAVAVWFFIFRGPPDVPLQFWTVAFSPDGKTVVTAGGLNNPSITPQLGELMFWNAANGKKKRVVRRQSTIRSLAWAPDGRFIVIGDFGGAVQLLDPGTSKIIANLPPHGGGSAGSVNAVAVSGDSKMVACASVDGTVSLWDVAGKELDPLMLPPGEKTFNVAISPDHRTVAAAGRLGMVYVFEVAPGASPRPLEAYHGPKMAEPRVEAIAFAPDGQTFATGCQQTVRVWETASGKLLRDLAGSPARVNCMAFSPDGTALATVHHDGTLMLWNPTSGDLINSTTAHQNESFGVAFAPDGRRIVTVGRKDYTGKIWDAHTLALQATMRRNKS